MATVEDKDVKDVVEQIVALKRAILANGSDGRARLNAIPVDDKCKGILNNDDQFDSTNWGTVKDIEKSGRYSELLQIRDSLQAASQLDGPPDDRHIMHASYASTEAIYACAALGGILIVALLCLIAFLWDDALNVNYAERINTAVTAVKIFEDATKEATKLEKEAPGNQSPTVEQKKAFVENALQTASLASIQAIRAIQENKGAKESTVLQMIMLLGALGGTLHLVGSLVNYVGERKLRRSWLLYYFAIPFVGAALAPMVYMLLRVGILTPTGQGNGGTAIANLNLISIYAFAALTGMFAKIATEKLGDVFTAMFQPRPDRVMGDKISSDKAVTSQANTIKAP